ncbi:hypothetical protein QR680_014594 [Steinernema hermaphroditum]|uniref:Polycomb protein VEFS-Box domain-containing protein n=1 Tax=Steinernema hermaphroditum TaxID=289476 RepID=A0AA39IAX0_9BILA|nr:hypothetical protein QR680_014594 [Steinernema hermaphroditum]
MLRLPSSEGGSPPSPCEAEMARKLARSCKKRYGGEGAYYDPETSGDEEDKLPPATRRPIRGRKRAMETSDSSESETESDSISSGTEEEEEEEDDEEEEEEEEVPVEVVVKPKRGRPAKKKPKVETVEEPKKVTKPVPKLKKEPSIELHGESETETSRSSLSTNAQVQEVPEKKAPPRPRGRPPKKREPSVAPETELQRLKKALLLYDYLNIDTGKGYPPVYRPFLMRNLPYLSRVRMARKKKSLKDAMDHLRARNNMPVSPKKTTVSIKKAKSPEKPTLSQSFNDPPALSVLFCSLRHPSFVGLPKADIQVYVVAESDGKFGEVEKVPSSNFPMVVNQKVSATCIDMPADVGGPLPKGINTRAHFLVVRVIFHEKSGTLSNGKSLRTVGSRRGGACSSSSGDSRQVMVGACCLVEVTRKYGIRWGTEKGINLVDASKVNAVSGAEWCRDRSVVPRTMELGKKSNTNPFLLVDFVEDQDDNSDSDSDSEASQSVMWPEQKTLKAKMEESGEQSFVAVRQKHEMELQIPYSLLYNFVTPKDEPPQSPISEPDETDFSAQPLGQIVDIGIKKRGFKMDLIPDTDTAVSRIVQSADKCIFCNASFVDMYALMMHLRSSYPRLEFVYKGFHRVLDIPTIEITVNSNFDASNDLHTHEYDGKRSRGPKKRLRSSPVYLVTPAERHHRKTAKRTLNIFQNPADVERRLMEQKQPIFFDPRTLHPFYIPGEDDWKKNNDQEWRRKLISTKFDDYVDLDPKEQEFMKLWGIFCLKDECRPRYQGAFYQACRKFLVLHRQDLLDKELEFQWVSHVTTYKELDCLDDDQSYDLIQRYYVDQYEPTEDALHYVSRELEARRVAESKRLREKDTNAKKERRSRTRSPPSFILRQNNKRSTHGSSADQSRQSSVARSIPKPENNGQAAPKRGRNREPDFSLYLKSYGV